MRAASTIAYADPPPPGLAGRLGRLNDSLQELALRLRGAIAAAVGAAAADAVRDAVRAALGGERPEEESQQGASDDPNEGREWGGEGFWQPRQPRRAPSRPDPWLEAARAAAQAGLWWLGRQPRRRPLLTAAAAAAAAGAVALGAGPSLAALLGVLATAATLLLTADSARSAAELLGA